MPRPEDVIYILCNEHLHRYAVPINSIDLKCPVCGCRYGRMETGGPVADTEARVVVDTKEPYAVPVGETWVSALPEKDNGQTSE